MPLWAPSWPKDAALPGRQAGDQFLCFLFVELHIEILVDLRRLATAGT